MYFDTGQPVNVGEFDLNKGFIYGNSPINITGTLTWDTQGFRSGGAITALGNVTLEVPSGSYKTLDRNFNNTQTTTMLGGGLALGGPGSVRWYNLPAALFHIQANSVSISGRTFENAGTLWRSSGDGTATISSRFENTGLIHNETGTMILSGGGVHSGDVRSDPGTLLKLGRTTEFLPGSTLNADEIEFGAGSDSVVRGSVHIRGSMSVTGGTWTFSDEVNVVSYGTDLIVGTSSTNGAVIFEGPTEEPIEFDTIAIGPGQTGASTMRFDTGQPVNVNTLTMIRGTLLGSSPINVGDSFVWRNGNIRAGGDLKLDGDSVLHSTSSARTVSRDVTNAGTFTILGSFSLGSGAQFTNLPRRHLRHSGQLHASFRRHDSKRWNVGQVDR